jgi:two-component sensor histidine kinase
MENSTLDEERLKDKIDLVLRVNYISSSLAIVFAAVCFYLLKITQILPETFLFFGIFNLINTLLFKYHRNLTVTYNLSSMAALACTLLITLYSGGIGSPFIFILALIVFAGYVTTRKYGQVYLNLILFLVILIFSQSLPEFSVTYNVIPPKSQNLFNLFSVLFSVYLLGNVFGKNLLRTHHRLYKSKLEIAQQIKERETLLKEIHHRVKNNLQTVSSLLSLQSRSITDPKMKSLFKSSQNRVISMAMVHEMLYMRNDLSKIEYHSYVQELSEYLIRSLKGSENRVKLNIDIKNIKLGIDTAIPLGLLINEAITNALKYGIKGDQDGEISIAIKKEKGGQYILNISDNGVGYPENIDFKSTKTLGLKLIHNLARQLEGSINRDATKKGTFYIVKFKEVGAKIPVIA